MFEEVGHHVEKIRRVGYGPLVLDVEPGKVRELDHAEVEALRLTASASAQLLAAQFDFANQNLKISELKQGQLERDITIERERNQFRTRLFVALGMVSAAE